MQTFGLRLYNFLPWCPNELTVIKGHRTMKKALLFLCCAAFGNLYTASEQGTPADVQATIAEVEQGLPAIMTQVEAEQEDPARQHEMRTLLLNAEHLLEQHAVQDVQTGLNRDLLPAVVSRKFNNAIIPTPTDGNYVAAGQGILEHKDYVYFRHSDNRLSRIDPVSLCSIKVEHQLDLDEEGGALEAGTDHDDDTIAPSLQPLVARIFTQLHDGELSYTVASDSTPAPLTAAIRDRMLTEGTPFRVQQNGKPLEPHLNRILSQHFTQQIEAAEFLGDPPPAHVFDGDTRFYQVLNTEQTIAADKSALIALPPQVFQSRASNTVHYEDGRLKVDNQHGLTIPWSLNLRQFALLLAQVAGSTKLHRSFQKARTSFIVDQMLTHAHKLYGSMRYKSEKGNQPGLNTAFKDAFTFVPLNIFRQPEILRSLVVYTFFFEIIRLLESATQRPKVIQPLMNLLMSEVSRFMDSFLNDPIQHIEQQLEDKAKEPLLPGKINELRNRVCETINEERRQRQNMLQIIATLLPEKMRHFLTSTEPLTPETLPTFLDQEVPAIEKELTALEHDHAQLAQGISTLQAAITSGRGAPNPEEMIQRMIQEIRSLLPDKKARDLLKKNVEDLTPKEKTLLYLTIELPPAQQTEIQLQAKEMFDQHYGVPRPKLGKTLVQALSKTFEHGSLPFLSISLNGLLRFFLTGFAGVEGGITGLLVSKYVDEPVMNIPYVGAFAPNTPLSVSPIKLLLKQFNSRHLHLNRTLRPKIYDNYLFKLMRMLVTAFFTIRGLNAMYDKQWRIFFMKNQGILKAALAQYMSPHSSKQEQALARQKIESLVATGNTLPKMTSPIGMIAGSLQLTKVANFFNDAQPFLRARSRAAAKTNLILLVPIFGRLFGIDLMFKRFFSPLTRYLGGSQ